MGAGFLDIETMVRKLQSETRSERLEQRIKPTMKQMIELAAMLTGTDTSEFVTNGGAESNISARPRCYIGSMGRRGVAGCGTIVLSRTDGAPPETKRFGRSPVAVRG
jgi:hypothetical protein